jgi:hypothetical protein
MNPPFLLLKIFIARFPEVAHTLETRLLKTTADSLIGVRD